MSRLVETLDEYVRSSECACLGLEESVIGIDGCLVEPPSGDACTGEASFCAAIVAGCEVLGDVMLRNSDIDLDGDGENDAISVFLRMEMTGTTLTGVR